jgi:3-isopropylmalate/(R)-2-methylmalate dehydratase large subunit
MAKKTLYNKVWDAHRVAVLPTGQDQLLIGLHLVHEVTSPQAFDALRENNWTVAFPERTFATCDHIIPTHSAERPFEDAMAETMMSALEKNVREFGIPLYNLPSGKQGIVHIVGPERGLTQPGMTIACGDSHTSTHGAFGTLAFGIGTSQVRDVLATGCLAMDPLKVRKIEVTGKLSPGVTPKDVILHIINRLGVNGGLGYAYEYAGEVFDTMSMEGRMTVCNMSIEGGARIGYVNPDEETFRFLKGREFAPSGEAWDSAVTWWKTLASDEDAEYDDVVVIIGEEIRPMITWGINPGQSVAVDENLPVPEVYPPEERASLEAAYNHMKWVPGQKATELPVQTVFIGSCTNGRLSDLREAAGVVKGKKIHPGIRGIVVPGSQEVRKAAMEEGLHRIFEEAGFQWRLAGCSMCLAMNPDKLSGDEICASSSNRNFIGRQGSARGRTLLMSPAMAAAAALNGRVTDVRNLH